MAGKSTFMRQVALISVMAQIGSFVPAHSARLGTVDRIFTRIGASDDLAGGRSTFMVEMSEVADILKSATVNSLVLLDEIGRGTSTFDGMSVARSVLEYIHTHIGSKTLFATHYHELTDLAASFPGVVNYNVAVKKRGDDIVFLRRIVPGGADDSYGVEVASLAGLPAEVISRAKVILKDLEANSQAPRSKPSLEEEENLPQTQQVIDALLSQDPDTLSPLEALGVLYKLYSQAKEIRR
jgi:DNA mismatch repair protein MutS